MKVTQATCLPLPPVSLFRPVELDSCPLGEETAWCSPLKGSKRKKLLLEGEDVCLLTKPISMRLPLGHRTRVPKADAGTSNVRL